MTELEHLRIENKKLKEVLNDMVKQVKIITRQFTDTSLRYAQFKYIQPSFFFSLETVSTGQLGQLNRSNNEITIFLNSLSDTCFMKAFKKGDEEALIKFVTECIQHEYIHSCLKSIAIFSESDEEVMVESIMAIEFEWWRKQVYKKSD